ncbi:MAG: hypothetical protein A3I73_00855 [Omnitrophica bacterium RIFCSPLOWO2_02_FULL_45_16]|nr:MAG: hypothetical protein A3C51_04280 [Omnitrophica bacterium RIFCSPHIGHO2_02_FULL_46_20]OGX00754.1 MAG: hypothetical protein A3I73_00855 [Omnitrophica bacterium RIFCSPLOWO2_02_FULL_45_16]
MEVTALKLGIVKTGIRNWRLAQLIGISEQELSNYATGRRRCPADLRHKIAKVLDVSVDELFPAGFDEEAERLRKHGDVW